jgi:hypothetical protein
MPDPGRFDAIFVLKFFHFSSEKKLATITIVTNPSLNQKTRPLFCKADEVSNCGGGGDKLVPAGHVPG